MTTAVMFAAFMGGGEADFSPFEPPLVLVAPAPRAVAPPVVTYREEYRVVNGVVYRVLVPTTQTTPQTTPQTMPLNCSPFG